MADETLQCPSCQGKLEPGWKVCPHCGIKIEAEHAEPGGEETLRRIVREEMDKQRTPEVVPAAVSDSSNKTGRHWTEWWRD